MRVAEGSCILHHISAEAAAEICTREAKPVPSYNKHGLAHITWKPPRWAVCLQRTALSEQELARV